MLAALSMLCLRIWCAADIAVSVAAQCWSFSSFKVEEVLDHFGGGLP